MPGCDADPSAPALKTHRAEDVGAGTTATGFAAVPRDFSSDTEAQAVMRGTHDGFRDALLSQLRDAGGESADEAAHHLDVWRATAAAQSDTLQVYARAQHALADGLWQTREVQYVFDTVAAVLGVGPKTPSEGSDSTRVRPCGAAAPLVRAAIDAYQREHDGAAMPRDAYSAAATRYNALFTPPDGRPARLLDVGSCYNPFGRGENRKPWLDVTAVDLQPSARAPDVLKCDWMAVDIADGDESSLPVATSSADDGPPLVRSIRTGSFDVVVMSYLLSFLPSAALRLLAVRKALRCLRPGGILVIVEARRGGHRVGGWPARWTAAIEANAGVDAVRVRQDVMKKSVGLVFAVGVRSLAGIDLPRASTGLDVAPVMSFDHEGD